MNRDEIMRTFHLLSRRTGIVWWAARKGDKLEGSWASSPLELVQFAEAYSDWDFYVQPNPSARRHGKRCRTEDIAAWEWFLVDLDPKDGVKTINEPWARMNEDAVVNIQHLVDSYSGKANKPFIIFSGRGIQLWYSLGCVDLTANERWPVRRVDLTNMKVTTLDEVPLCVAIPAAQSHWLEYLASHFQSEYFNVDTSSSDLPRLMRCPGTINRKTGLPAYVAKEGEDQQGAAMKGLWRKLLNYTPTAKMLHKPAPSVPGAPWQVAAALTKSKTAADFLTFGATEPGRHKVACATARALAEAGIDESEIVKALERGGQLSRPVLDDPEYIARTAADAVRRFGLDKVV
jgi:hypothetical protein